MTDPPKSSPSSTPAAQYTQSISGAAGLIGAATFTSRILGFIRDIVLAQLFGASASADAFYVAYRIPNLLRELFAEGSMSSAFIPVFTEYHTLRSKKETWELASAAFTTLVTIITVVTLLGIVAAPGLVWLLAPGFHEEAAKLATTTLLTQVMFPYLFFVSLAAFAMGILNSFRAFAWPAVSPVFFNLCIIFFALGVSPLFHEPIIAVAVGVVVGGLAQFLVQLPAIHKRGMLFSWRFQPGHPGVRQMGLLILPTLVGLSVYQVNITVNTILASYFSGGPTYLFYGTRLIQFPLGIFSVALATAILPTLSAQAARKELDDLRRTISYSLRMIFFIILPAMTGLIFLREPIIHLFFEHGAFSARDTAATAGVLLAFSLGLWAIAGNRILITCFYSLQDTKTPTMVAILGMGTNLVFALWLMSPLQYRGLALAASLSAMVNYATLLAILTRRLGGLNGRALRLSFARNVLALVPVALASYWVAELAVWHREAEWIAKSVMLFVGIGLSATGYFGVHALLRSEELEGSWGIVKKKLRLN
ncbi:MAG: murein biosynthesis integral membrane protein MurJ [Nitrospirota bacterium]|nr:MAG: murein biosynthesis integral membrane protein MurJ [Nitrospirota bacterium]